MYGWNATLKSIFINNPVTAVKKYNSFALPPQHSYPGVAGYDFCSFGKKATPSLHPSNSQTPSTYGT